MITASTSPSSSRALVPRFEFPELAFQFLDVLEPTFRKRSSFFRRILIRSVLKNSSEYTRRNFARMPDPASASPNRINACFAIRAFAGVRTVCRQSRGKHWRNVVGKVAGRPASARQSSLIRRSDRAQISHTKRSPNANLRSVLEAMA